VRLAYRMRSILSTVPRLRTIVDKAIADSPEYQQWLNEQNERE